MEMTGKQGQQYSYQTKQTETKAIEMDKEGHYIKIKGPIKEEKSILINICPPKRRIQIHKTTTNRQKGRN